MRRTTTAGRWLALHGLAIGALLTLIAPLARAQAVDPIEFDGNILWNNGATGSLHYVGGVTPGTCTAGVSDSTRHIATVQYTRNSIVDPLLSGALDIAAPNWRPALGSPAFCGNPGHGRSLLLPDDGFFTNVPWVGAFGPSEPDWTAGWTYYSLDGAGRTDLQPGRPLQIQDNFSFYSNRTFSADTNYLVRGQLRVKEQARLTIPAGTVIFQEAATVGTIVIERGAFIDAQGTATAPIIITSDAAPGAQVPGGGGGLFIHGRATTNVVNSCAGDSAASEGGTVGFFGGADDADSSGVLRYVRIEFAGVVIFQNNEANAFTFNSVGSRTVIEHLQAHRGKDDLFEFFGGTARAKYLVGTYGDDDGFDWQLGYKGKAQFVVIRQLASEAGADKGIEADNNEFSNNTELCSGRSNPFLSNFTIIGDLRTGAGLTGAVGAGVQLRRGTSARFVNSILTNWKGGGFEINGSSTFTNHCTDQAAIVARPIACAAGSVDAPLASAGRVFVTSGYPNPFRGALYSVRFSLPQAGRVAVDVYAADGRHVANLAEGDFAAGEHTVRWNAGRSLPAGLYFYAVRGPQGTDTGKMVRIQ